MMSQEVELNKESNKLRRNFLHLSFDGTGFSGWQRQVNSDNCIQTVIEENLTKILKEKIYTTGCGRTDAGVHASQFYLHFDYNIMDIEDLKTKLNYSLPDQILIHEIIPVHENAHARFDAREREYTFYLHFERDPFISRFSSYYPIAIIDIDIMNQACELLLKTKDFVSFCKTPQRMNHTLCEILSISLELSENKRQLIFKIRANRFLKSMVRIIMHELLELGQKKSTLESFKELIEGKRTKQIDKIAYPQGLFLSNVKYDYL